MPINVNLGVIFFVLTSVLLQLAAVQDTSATDAPMYRPVNISVDPGYKTLNISWSPPHLQDNETELVNYRVYWHRAFLPDSEPEQGDQSVPPNVTTYLIKGLWPGTKYKVYVASNYSARPESKSLPLLHQTWGFGGHDNPCDCEEAGINMSISLSERCDYKTGNCTCKDKFTKGFRCDQCYVNYFWHPDVGCLACNCPPDRSNGACYEDNSAVRCTCLNNYDGPKCAMCKKGFYLDSKEACAPCQCNNNTDPTASSVCDDKDKCLDCGYNTSGDHCEECKEGYAGDALHRNCTKMVPMQSLYHHRHVKMVMGICVTLVVIIVLVTFTMVYCRLRRRHRPLKLWTIALNNDQERVNFSTRMEQTEYVDPNLLSREDGIQYYDKERSTKPILSLKT